MRTKIKNINVNGFSSLNIRKSNHFFILKVNYTIVCTEKYTLFYLTSSDPRKKIHYLQDDLKFVPNKNLI